MTSGTGMPQDDHIPASAPQPLLASMRVLVPFAVLCAVAVLLPMQMPRPVATASDELCATFGEGPAAPWDLRRLEECSALDRTNVDLLADLASAYDTADAQERAVTTYRQALAIDPANADLRLRLGRLLLRRGDAEQAHREAVAVLELQPNRAAAVDLRDTAARAGSEASR